MPKKRHQSNFSKPPSTAPASLGVSRSRLTSSEQHTQGVNELLARLRRATLASSDQTSASPSFVNPGNAGIPGTLPPSLRQILQIPETPSPTPRRPARRDAGGRRLPPGPRPPRSWLERRVRDDAASARDLALSESGPAHFHPMPGSYVPDPGSLIDLVLRRMTTQWDFQSDYDQYYLHTLHGRLRSALVSYVGTWGDRGISGRDLRRVFMPQHGQQEETEGIEDLFPAESAIDLNHDVHCLDLSGSISRTLTIRELMGVLFPPQLAQSAVSTEGLQESWDAAETSSPPCQLLLPNLTHLSLAVDPSAANAGGKPPLPSWKHLLALAARLPGLTHLSLAYWPAPSLTPNSKTTTVVPPTGAPQAVPYSGTGPYAHSLDDDFSEAVILLRQLSRLLYRLEYLDLTGCGAWFSALMYDRDGDRVDWQADWGNVTTLLLYDGYGVSEDTLIGDTERRTRAAAAAERVEKHIVAKRAGNGRFINVDKDAAQP